MNLGDRIVAAWEKRGTFPAAHHLVRAFDGAGDGEPHLVVDRFGTVALVHLFEGDRLDDLRSDVVRIAPKLVDLLGVSAVYGWVHRRDARRSAAEGCVLLGGEECPEVWCVEHTLRLLVRPRANVNGGLFLDTRAIRGDLVGSSGGHRVLNTFCFTGSLGLAAWCGGASEVVQVDISKGILGWARENLAGNAGRGSGEVRFLPEDSRAFMEKEARRIARGTRTPFDTVIVDPPSFGSSDGVVFSYADDIGPVLVAALGLLKPGGRLFCTTNFRRATHAIITTCVRDAAAAAGRTLRAVDLLGPPAPDFTAPLPDSYAMRGVVATVER
jgi:23S rRNA (cytosine1962-C5)-methyltransferase